MKILSMKTASLQCVLVARRGIVLCTLLVYYLTSQQLHPWLLHLQELKIISQTLCKWETVNFEREARNQSRRGNYTIALQKAVSLLVTFIMQFHAFYDILWVVVQKVFYRISLVILTFSLDCVPETQVELILYSLWKYNFAKQSSWLPV